MADREFSVAITDFVAGEPVLELEALEGVAQVTALEAEVEGDLASRVEQMDALIVYHYIELSADTIGRLERCKVISRGGVGFDNVDLEAAREKGIPVCNVPDYGTEDVADSAVGMLVSMMRGVAFQDARLRADKGPWSPTEAAPLKRIRGSILGIVGLGRIGTATAHRAKALGMDVAFYDPYKQDGYDKANGVRRVETLEELLTQSHAVSIHCPLTEETRHLLNTDTIALMPKGSYLVNTARGGVVDTACLPDAIVSGRLAGAGIDVFEWEQPPPDDPVVKAWRDPDHPACHRLLVTPHCAFYSEQSLIDLRVKAAHNCRRALLGQSLRNVVNDIPTG